MPLPAGVTAIEAFSAATGTVQVLQSATPSVGSGFQVSAAPASYPAELLAFLPADNYVSREVIRFHADGVFWNNDLAVAMHGYFSQSREPLLCLPEVSSSVPINRYINSVTFSEGVSSETLSSGLLTVQLQTLQALGGSADDPHLQFLVNGKFDPVGFGDARYEFLLAVDTHASVWLTEVRSSTSQLAVSQEHDHVLVHFDQ